MSFLDDLSLKSCNFDVFGSDTDAVKIMSVMEGESVTLHTNITSHDTKFDRYYMDYIEWSWFRPEESCNVKIFQLDVKTGDIRYHDEIFRDRLQIDNQTGSLTIRNIRTTESGFYQMYSTFTVVSFNVTVYGE